jgi:hypothetical protein
MLGVLGTVYFSPIQVSDKQHIMSTQFEIKNATLENIALSQRLVALGL